MGDSRPGKLEERLAQEVILIISAVVLVLVQTTLLPTPLGFPPAILLILVICRILLGVGSAAPEADIGIAIRWAFYGGISLDICAVTPIGSHSLALLLAIIVVVMIASQFHVGGALLPLLTVLLGTLIYELTLAIIYHLTVAAIDWGRYVMVILIPGILVTLIPTLPIFHLMRWRMQRV